MFLNKPSVPPLGVWTSFRLVMKKSEDLKRQFVDELLCAHTMNLNGCSHLGSQGRQQIDGSLISGVSDHGLFGKRVINLDPLNPALRAHFKMNFRSSKGMKDPIFKNAVGGVIHRRIPELRRIPTAEIFPR